VPQPNTISSFTIQQSTIYWKHPGLYSYPTRKKPSFIPKPSNDYLFLIKSF